MALADDILFLAPVLYWKLDDPSGPAASDSSGNGHPGVYGGGFTLLQYGPEPGTYAAQFAAGGSVTCTGMPQAASAPFTIVWYSSRLVISTPTQGDEIVNGSRASLRGSFFLVSNSNQIMANAYQTGGLAAGGSPVNVPIWNHWWHAYALSCPGTGVVSSWCDGAVAQATSSNLGTTTLSTDTFGATPPYAAVIAHVAYFNKLLTPAQISQLHGYRYDWPFGPMVNVTWPSPPAGSSSISPTDPVIVDINDDLDEIRGAVIHDYTTGAPG